MTRRRSAGILLHRPSSDGATTEVMIVHPGGPFWARKDDGAWSIPKGEYDESEDAWTAATREFGEEIGRPVPDGDRTDLGEITQKGGKHVCCFAVAADLDVSDLHSNEFEIEWPPRSGRRQSFPEVDRAEWFTLADARTKLLAAQLPFLDHLDATLSGPASG